MALNTQDVRAQKCSDMWAYLMVAVHYHDSLHVQLYLKLRHSSEALKLEDIIIEISITQVLLPTNSPMSETQFSWLLG